MTGSILSDAMLETIYPGCLSAPLSPVLPHTPFPHVSDGALESSLHPRTPYTPYTAFQSKQNPFFTSSGPGSNASLYLLDDSDNLLAGLYNKILRFIDVELGPVMSAAERVSVKRHVAPSITLQKGQKPPLDGFATGLAFDSERTDNSFNIFADVVVDTFARALMDDLGSVVFSAGKPDEFRKVLLARFPLLCLLLTE